MFYKIRYILGSPPGFCDDFSHRTASRHSRLKSGCHPFRRDDSFWRRIAPLKQRQLQNRLQFAITWKAARLSNFPCACLPELDCLRWQPDKVRRSILSAKTIRSTGLRFFGHRFRQLDLEPARKHSALKSLGDRARSTVVVLYLKPINYKKYTSC
jgi:hypothetical protein